MSRRGANVLASSLGLLTLAVFVFYRSTPRVLIAGSLYLVAANGLALIAAFRSDRKESDFKAPVLVIASWQVAAIGLLNMWSLDYPEPQGFALCYLATAVALGLAYSIVGLADSSEQDGGYVPVSYLGRPRSRRMLFTAFIFAPIGLLVIADVVIWSSWPWRPVPFEPPRLCLLLIALTSIMVFWLVSRRYLNSFPNKRLFVQIAAVMSFGLIGVGATNLLLDFSAYNYVLSAIAAISIAGTIYSLSLARPLRTNSLQP